MLKEFIDYLNDQVGMPYLWGGQHTKLTPQNYISIIEKKESGKGGYDDGESYAKAVIDFCKKKFDEGLSVLYAYDCSGLGCYWLYNLKHLYKCDVNANTMMSRCDLRNDFPKKGWWVFRLNGKRASHIGYMIDDQYLVEAKGRKYGVVKTKFKTKDWHCWGIPNVFKDDINAASDSFNNLPVEDEKPTITPIKGLQVIVVGERVNVRKTCQFDSKGNPCGKILFTAKKRNRFNLIGIDEESGWYYIETYKGNGYISNKEKYTKIEEK